MKALLKLRVAVIVVLFSSSLPNISFAQSITVAGTLTGAINETPLEGTYSGTFDPTGANCNLNDLFLTFNAIPGGYHPFAVGTCNFTWKCTGALKATPPAQNLFQLSGGNYFVNRVFTWPSLPGDSIVGVAAVSTVGSNMFAKAEMFGTYSGPTNLVSVSNIKFTWTVIEDVGIAENASAMIHTPTDSFAVNWKTSYRFPSPISIKETGTYAPDLLTFSGNQQHIKWCGSIKAVPSSGGPGPVSASVPTFSQWSLIAVLIAFITMGTFYILRRKQSRSRM